MSMNESKPYYVAAYTRVLLFASINNAITNPVLPRIFMLRSILELAQLSPSVTGCRKNYADPQNKK